MRTVLLTLLIVAGSLLTAQTRDDGLPKVTHYKLSARFFLKEQRVRLECRLTIRNVTPNSLYEIPFLLYRLLNVEGVTDESGGPLPFNEDVVQLSDEPSLQVKSVVVKLAKPLLPNDTVNITVRSEGFIFGYPEVMAYVRDRIDESYALLRPDALAYPMLARPSFASIIAAYDTKFTYEILATVPKGYTAVCGGEPDNAPHVETDSAVFVFHSKVPTWRMDLAVAKFAVLAYTSDKLMVYYLPGDSAGAGRVLEESRKAIGFYSGMFGRPQGYRGYTVIEIPDGWGSQASDFYFLQTAAAFKDTSRIGEVYHEIGHSWNVKASPSIERCRYFDEAFASFFESLAIRSFEGERRFEEEMKRSRALFVKSADRDRQVFDTPIASYGSKEMGRHSYTKGAWSLYVLDQLVGDKVFARIIRSMLAQFERKTIDFAGFRELCERTSGKNLGKYFDEWIYGAESSRLLTEDVPITDIVKRY